MKISVIIPTYNRANQITKVLDSFVKQDYPLECFEILVIDNNSTDNTKEIVLDYCRQFSQVKYIYEPIPSLISGRHRGAKDSKGEILIFCDDDIQLPEDNVLRIINETFTSNPNVGLIGSKYLPNYQTTPPKWLNFFWNSTPYGGKMCSDLSLLDLGNEPLIIDARYVWGLFYAIRKSVLFECGGFHPDATPIPYLRGDGETGLSEEINRRGIISFYIPVIVKHEVSNTRMTPNYFLQRHYSQGLSDSYTDIRKGKREAGIFKITNNKKTILSKIRQFASNVKQILKYGYYFGYAKRLKKTCLEKYREGYCFHNSMALNNDEILNWVLKADYWDYSHPDLDKIKEVSSMPDSKVSLHR